MSEEISNGNGSANEARDQINFGFASRIEELKGPLQLMTAFAGTHKEIPGVRLRMAGEGSQKLRVHALARSLNVATNYDYNGLYTRPDERKAFMHDVDVFVMPSFTEGTANCIIEAMANGKPVIASAVGGIPDMIDSESGILVSPGDTQALSHAMTQLATDTGRRLSMGRAARERYVKLFSPKAVVPLMLETYARIAGMNGGSIIGESNGSSHPWRTAII